MSAFAEGETLFGTFYPRGYVVAVFREQAEAEQCATILRDGGFEDVRVWSGQEVLDRHAAITSQQNTLQKLGALFGSDEKLALEDYLDLAKDGRSFLTAHAHDHQHALHMQQALHGHNAHRMRYYGDIGMIDLTPA